MKKVRVLIVDDSATVRALLTQFLEEDPDIEVVGAAPEPAAARDMIKALNPDVLTLDIEMPNMNGLQFLEKIMRLRPMPVVMVSTLTEAGAEITLDALAMGAVDFVAKPGQNLVSGLSDVRRELCDKVKAAARASVRRAAMPVALSSTPPPQDFGSHLIAIGSSTGGVEALLEVLSAFPANCPPTLITQHMPAGFTSSFARRLDRLCAPAVSEAQDGMTMAPGMVVLAPGGQFHLEVSGRASWRCHLRDEAAVNGHRPSVDMLFHSVARSAGERGIGAILTGMGRDGAAGLLAMRQLGARTIGQDEATSIVYGMPRAAVEIGAVEKQLPLARIGSEIIRLASRTAAGER